MVVLIVDSPMESAFAKVRIVMLEREAPIIIARRVGVNSIFLSISVNFGQYLSTIW
jgi:hypothetical protein